MSEETMWRAMDGGEHVWIETPWLDGGCEYEVSRETAARLGAELLDAAGLRHSAVFAEVAAERARQDARWGQQDHPDHPPGEAWAALGRLLEVQARSTLRTTGGLSWAAIAAEEVGEALNAPDVADLRAEIVQVAAVAVAWIEAIDRRGGR